jgi:processive 1,2-diacylglycerol beta-glucosyltransferase
VNSSQACKLQTILGKDALAAVCTQAFPCGLVSSYKKNIDPNIKLFAVLTDYAPHSFWIYDNVDTYFVPAEEIGESLIRSGVPRDRISVSGIPIDPVFGERLSKDQAKIKCGFTAKGPVLLLMGGSQGVGAMKDVLLSLASKKTPFQVAAIAGKNKALYSWLKRFADSNLNANLNVHPFMYVDKINELMDASDIIISKPGGITTAEAFSKGLPLFIISPIPGQEQMNTDFFLKRGIAVMLGDPRRAFDVIDSYASNISRLSEISRKASSFSKPDSAAVIARRVLEIVGTGHAVSV